MFNYPVRRSGDDLARWGGGGIVHGGNAPIATARRPTVSGMLREWGPWPCCMALFGE